MNDLSFYKDFVSYCEKNANADMVKKYQRYFKDGYNAYGLTQQLMDEKVKEILQRKDFSMDLLVKAAPAFFRNGKYETTSVILSLLNRLHPKYNAVSSPYLFFKYGGKFQRIKGGHSLFIFV